MTAPGGIGVSITWPRVTAVLLIVVAVLAAATNWPGDPQAVRIAEWVGAAMAALVAIAGLLTYRQLPLAALAAEWLRSRRGAARRWPDPERMNVLDHRHRYGRAAVGIRETDGHLLSVISVAGGPEPAGLPISTVADGLRQLDVALEAIDVVSISGRGVVSVNSRRVVSINGRAAGAASTWVVLRMDARANLPAVIVRDSVASTFAAATERLADDLGGDGRTIRILTAAEIADVDDTLLAGLDPEHLRIRLGRAEYRPPGGPDIHITSGWLAAGDIASAVSRGRPDSDVAVLTLTLTPRADGTWISALVRRHHHEPLSDAAEEHRLTGRQLAAITASRPVPVPRTAVVLPGCELAAAGPLVLPLDALSVAPTEAALSAPTEVGR